MKKDEYKDLSLASKQYFYKSFSVSSDGKLIIAVSRFNFFHVWSLDSKQFVRKIELKSASNSELVQIKDCAFIPGFCYDNKLLTVLTSEGSLSIYNIETSQLVANLHTVHLTENTPSQIISEQKLIQIHLASNSRYLSAVSQDGMIQVYDIDSCNAIKTMKTTSALMTKSTTINSTVINKTALESAKDKVASFNSVKNQNRHNISKVKI